MLDRLQHKVQHAAARTARKAAFGLGAFLCLAVGLAFLTAAAWMFIVSVTTALNAALIIGAAYFGVGLILIAVMSSADSDDRRVKQSEPEQSDNHEMLAKMVAAFMTGVTAGRKSRS